MKKERGLGKGVAGGPGISKSNKSDCVFVSFFVFFLTEVNKKALSCNSWR